MCAFAYRDHRPSRCMSICRRPLLSAAGAPIKRSAAKGKSGGRCSSLQWTPSTPAAAFLAARTSSSCRLDLGQACAGLNPALLSALERFDSPPCAADDAARAAVNDDSTSTLSGSDISLASDSRLSPMPTRWLANLARDAVARFDASTRVSQRRRLPWNDCLNPPYG